MRPLAYWLLLVAFFRLSSVYFGYFNKWALQVAVYSQTQMSEVHARTFAVWTALTCALCCICAFNLDDAPIYLATMLSFVAAFSHFFAEFVIYKTMSVKTFSLVGLIAGVSIVWMALDWGSVIHNKQFR